MFIDTQGNELKTKYNSLLQKVGSLSRLYTSNETPYLYYRTAERIFCHALDTDDHTRSDISVDTSKDQSGIGLKTFTYTPSGSSFQKISEFNRLSTNLRELFDSNSELLIVQLANHYNRRLETAVRMIEIDRTFFHCVVRRPGAFLINEYPMDRINPENLSIIRTNIDNRTGGLKTIDFEDISTNTIYKFNTSKSTLYRKFDYQNPLYELPISIISDPFDFLDQIDLSDFGIEEPASLQRVFLPLYSRRGREIYVPEKSGLNHWNAGGRARDPDEMYIRIPISVHRNFPDFFPPRYDDFNLKLPSGRLLSVKVCQDNGKALMSNPNKALGEWLLRNVLDIPQGELLTYEDLLDIGIDSVEIRKIDDGNFEIDFKEVGTFEEFKAEHL